MGYARTASQIVNPDPIVDPVTDEATYLNYCDINWFQDKDTECANGLRLALEQELSYQAVNIPQDAPWFSESSGYTYAQDPSRRFLGVYGLSADALSDSTRSVGITEGILSGGVLGRERLAVPRFRFRVLLTAVDEEGLEYGKAWLSKALSEQSCSTHGASCGSSDLTFFARCPTFLADPSLPEQAYDEKVDQITRVFHDVKCIAGPVTVQQYNRAENSWGAIVEFDIAAGVATMFGLANPFIEISQDGETIIQDIPINDIPYPSAEISGTQVLVAMNYSLNPSVETNATGWSFGAAGGITTGMLAGSRVTGELSAVGTSSYRVVFTATGAGTNGEFWSTQTVDVSARPAGSRVSINQWAAEVVMSGVMVRDPIELLAVWRNASNVVVDTISIGDIPVNGGAVSAKSLVVPATATTVEVRAVATVVSWNAGSVLRLYADALAVTVP